MRTVLLIASGCLTAAAALPYIVAILWGWTVADILHAIARPAPLVRDRQRGRETVNPRIASWGIWTAAQAVGTAAALADSQVPSALYTLVCALGCAAVVTLGWRQGERVFERLDTVCATLASCGVALLILTVVTPRAIPMGTVVAISAGTDFLAYLPTFKHGFMAPREEPWVVYAMFGAGAGLALAAAALGAMTMTGVVYLLYLLAADSAMVVIILASPHRRDAPVAAPVVVAALPDPLAASPR